MASCRLDLNLNNWKNPAHREAGLGSISTWDSEVLGFEESVWDSAVLKKSSRTVSGEQTFAFSFSLSFSILENHSSTSNKEASHFFSKIGHEALIYAEFTENLHRKTKNWSCKSKWLPFSRQETQTNKILLQGTYQFCIIPAQMQKGFSSRLKNQRCASINSDTS